MKYLVLLLCVSGAGCMSASKDPFADPATPGPISALQREVLTLNPQNPALRPNEKREDYLEECDIEWRNRSEQGLLKFFEQEGVNFVDTPGAYIFMPKRQGMFMRNASHKYYLVGSSGFLVAREEAI